MSASVTGKEWVKAALTPRMVVLFILFTIAAVICVQLGNWQLSRSIERGARAAEEQQAAQAQAVPRPLAEVLAPQTEFRAEHLGAKVSVEGSYGEQVIVPGRQIDGAPATLIVTDLIVAGSGAHLPVVRGWVGPSQAGVRDGAVYGVDDPALAPPSGPVTVTGYLANSEQETTLSRVPGSINYLSTAQLVNLWGSPTYTGYLVLSEQTPGPVLPQLAPQPNLVKDAGQNWQNLGYAAEWFIFGGFALALWVKMVRDEARHRRSAA
ncbi:MAG: SURF1 family protein [Bowdeniella nasicola]|nr:SURF1 family protein [Bowdeniella nasicola]